MSMLDDPSMKEIVDDFCDETNELLDKLEVTLETIEDDLSTAHEGLETFGQIIDRIMGAARSIQAEEIGTFCELGKVIGYKSSQVADDEPLISVVVAVLFDSVDLLRRMVKSLETKDKDILRNLNTQAFATRLKWLKEKFKDIERASVSYDQEQKQELDQSSIDDLMASLGL